MEEIIAKSPWSFDKHLILLKRFHGDISPCDVKFKHASFLIRAFNVPIRSMNKEVGGRIAKEIGELVTVDVPRNGLAWDLSFAFV